VLDDHLNIAQRWGKGADIERVVQDDLDRNVVEDIVVLTNRGTFHGHDGVMELAQMLGEELPEHESFEYTHTSVEGRIAFLEWAYEDAATRVHDGADSYLIEDGKIVAQTIHYTVERNRRRAGFANLPSGPVAQW
jgi:SnoaL-like protein